MKAKEKVWLAKRRYKSAEDYWRIRAFLRDVFLRNGRLERSWQAYRFDYWRWHGIMNLDDGILDDIFLWEDGNGRIAAVLNQESNGQAFLQVDPAWQSAELEAEMIATAENCLARPNAEGRDHLLVWANEHDELRQDVLASREYNKETWAEYQRRRSLAAPIPEMHPAAGYTVRALGDAEEHPARSWLSWRAFHPDEPDEAYEGWDWYENIQRAPLYRRDLDLDSAIASVSYRAGDTRFRRELFAEMTRLALEDLPLIPLWYSRNLHAIRPGLGWTPRRDSRLRAVELTILGPGESR